MKVLRSIFSASLGGLLAISSIHASANESVDQKLLELYEAFDHHLPEDQKRLNDFFPLPEETETPSEIKQIVRAAYSADCESLGDTEKQEQCQDIVRVMLFPQESMKTDFGRKLYSILIPGDFSSPEGTMIARAFCIDPVSLGITRKFYEMTLDKKSGKRVLNTKLLPWFRYYARPTQVLNPSASTRAIVPDMAVEALNIEIENSFDALSRTYVQYAQQKVGYSVFFSVYRRHFQAKHFKARLALAAKKWEALDQNTMNMAMYQRQLFKISIPHLDSSFEKLHDEGTAVLRWLSWPMRFTQDVKRWMKKGVTLGETPELKNGLDSPNLLNEAEIREIESHIESLYQLEKAGLLTYWNMSDEGDLALLILFESILPHAKRASDETDRYQQVAQSIRMEHDWDVLSYSEIHKEIKNGRNSNSGNQSSTVIPMETETAEDLPALPWAR